MNFENLIHTPIEIIRYLNFHCYIDREKRIEYIGLGLSLKFGDDASLLMASIREIQDPDQLLRIMNAILTSCGIEEIRQLVGGKHGTA